VKPIAFHPPMDEYIQKLQDDLLKLINSTSEKIVHSNISFEESNILIGKIYSYDNSISNIEEIQNRHSLESSYKLFENIVDMLLEKSVEASNSLVYKELLKDDFFIAKGKAQGASHAFEMANSIKKNIQSKD